MQFEYEKAVGCLEQMLHELEESAKGAMSSARCASGLVKILFVR